MRKAIVMAAIAMFAISTMADGTNTVIVTVTNTVTDITVDIGTVTVSGTVEADVQTWLDSLPNIYLTTYVDEVRTNPDTGESVTITKPVKTLISETMQEKMSRVLKGIAVAELRSRLKALWQAREDEKVRETIDEFVDPITE